MTKAVEEDLWDLSSFVPLGEPTTAATKFSTIIYGRMKVGKSYLAASCSEVEGMFPVLWIACEDGTASFADDFPDIDVFRPETAQQVVDVVDKLIDNPTKYRTVVFDTGGAFQEMVKRDYIKAKKSMDFEGWGKVADALTGIINNLHYYSPYNSIFLFHTEKLKDDTLGSVMHMPYMLGNKAIKDIPPIVDNIFYLAKVEGEDGQPVRVLQTTGTSRVDAGGRFEKKIPAQIVDPTFSDIYGYLTKAAEEVAAEANAA